MMVAFMLTVTVTLTSCDPLRKKFTRKKKKDAVAEDRAFTPVLEPEEYLPPEMDPVEGYKQHYAFIKGWYNDLWSLLREKNAEKRVLYTLKQVSSHIEQMSAMVKPSVRLDLEKLQGYLSYYKIAMHDQPHMRNIARIQSDLRAFDRHLRQKLSPQKVKGYYLNEAGK